jgi:hypothetical protein
MSSSSNTADVMVVAIDQLDRTIRSAAAGEAAMASVDDIANQQQEPEIAWQPLLRMMTAAASSLQTVDEVRICSCCFVDSFVMLPCWVLHIP